VFSRWPWRGPIRRTKDRRSHQAQTATPRREASHNGCAAGRRSIGPSARGIGKLDGDIRAPPPEGSARNSRVGHTQVPTLPLRDARPDLDTCDMQRLREPDRRSYAWRKAGTDPVPSRVEVGPCRIIDNAWSMPRRWLPRFARRPEPGHWAAIGQEMLLEFPG